MSKFINNLKNFLESSADGFLKEEKKVVQELAQKEILSEDEKKQVIEFAKKAYPYNYAYLHVFNECCRVKEEVEIHNFLKDEGLKKRFDKFLKDGGDIEKIRQGRVDEEYLSEDDIEKFRNAEADVHKEVHRDVVKRIDGIDKEKFDEYVEEGKKKVVTINEKTSLLHQTATEAPEWSGQIFEKIKEMEERWVNYENEPQTEDLDELLEYYNSVQM